MHIVQAVIVFGILFGVGPALASSGKGPTAEETATYIAAKLENCGAFRWGSDKDRISLRAAMRGPDIAISQTRQPRYSSTFNMRNIDKVEFVGSIFGWDDDDRPVAEPYLILRCRDDEECAHIVYEGLDDQRSAGALIRVCDADTGERLGRAFRHLMEIHGEGQVKELF